jgi:hypothetical protein
MAQAVDRKVRIASGSWSVLLLASLGLLLTLSSCIDVECPNEFGRPLSRARYCGPSAP